MNGLVIIDQKTTIDGSKIRNGGSGNGGSSLKVQKFLEDHTHLFQRVSDGPYMNAHYLTNDRLPKFKEYIKSKGFEFKIEVRKL